MCLHYSKYIIYIYIYTLLVWVFFGFLYPINFKAAEPIGPKLFLRIFWNFFSSFAFNVNLDMFSFSWIHIRFLKKCCKLFAYEFSVCPSLVFSFLFLNLPVQLYLPFLKSVKVCFYWYTFSFFPFHPSCVRISFYTF